jgi:hypothetical protein
MGKKSLIKSTSKKKTAPAAKKEDKKATTPQAPAAKAKSAPKSKTPPESKSASKQREDREAMKGDMKKKEITIRDLIFMKFEVQPTEKLYSPPVKRIKPEEFIAPPYVTGRNKEETDRIRSLLFNRYSAEDLAAAAEKAAAEKAAAEKAAAEKAAAEKAAAEKAAAEKAAAEKAAAEKAAAEKAAAEKAAAEKAAAEKAAAEKAAAEKAAAEKAAMAKSAAEPKVSVSYEVPADKPKKAADPVEKGIKILAAGIALLILLIVGASYSNSGNYYLKSKDGALEIWKGRFAPLGEELMFSLPGVQMPEDVKPVYGKKEVYPLVFKYYIDKADALLQVEGLPDFEGIKAYVKKALAFSVSDKMRQLGVARLNNIDRLILIFKADVAASRATLDDLQAAMGYLKEADAISRDAADEALIKEKMKTVSEAMTALETSEAEKAAAEKAAAPGPQETAAPEKAAPAETSKP